MAGQLQLNCCVQRVRVSIESVGECEKALVLRVVQRRAVERVRIAVVVGVVGRVMGPAVVARDDPVEVGIACSPASSD
jgi:hypothetical protein